MEIKQASFTLSILGCTSADVQSEMNHLKLVYSLYNPGCAIEILDTSDLLADDLCFEGEGPREGKQLQWEGEGEAPIIPPSPWGIPVSRPHVEHEHDEAKKKMKKEKKRGVSP